MARSSLYGEKLDPGMSSKGSEKARLKSPENLETRRVGELDPETAETGSSWSGKDLSLLRWSADWAIGWDSEEFQALLGLMAK